MYTFPRTIRTNWRKVWSKTLLKSSIPSHSTSSSTTLHRSPSIHINPPLILSVLSSSQYPSFTSSILSIFSFLSSLQCCSPCFLFFSWRLLTSSRWPSPSFRFTNTVLQNVKGDNRWLALYMTTPILKEHGATVLICASAAAKVHTSPRKTAVRSTKIQTLWGRQS